MREPVYGTLIKRIGRFTCLVNIEGFQREAYLPNSGRLEELLIPGTRIVMEKRRQKGKRLYDLLLTETGCYPSGRPIWVCVDSRLPKNLLIWCIERGIIEEFKGAHPVKEEVEVEGIRLDLLLKGDEGDIYVETKSVNLIDLYGIARFPDAPTKRGSEHLRVLMELRKMGAGAYIVFVIMREDAKGFSPFAQRDPIFAERLSEAKGRGVRLIAIKFSSGINMRYAGRVNLILPPPAFKGAFSES